MKRKKLKIRSCPTKPIIKKNIKYTHNIYDGESLSELIDWAKIHSKTLDNIIIGKEWGYYDEANVYAYIYADELEEDFQNRIKYYKKKEKVYDEWYNNNREAIKKELKLREKEAVEEAEKKKERDKKKKEKEKIDLHKKLEKLTKQLEKIKQNE